MIFDFNIIIKLKLIKDYSRILSIILFFINKRNKSRL